MATRDTTDGGHDDQQRPAPSTAPSTTTAAARMRDFPATKASIARRTAEGKTIREIKRCLKRYITRQLYRTLTATTPSTSNNPAVA